MKTSLFLVTFLAAAAAHADGITIAGSDTEATLTLHGVHAIAPTIRPIGDRLEIDVADESAAQLVVFNDPTVKKVEVTGGAHAHISIQIKHSTHTTEILGKAAKVIDRDDALTIRIPRDAKAAAEMANEPASAPAPPPKAAAIVAPTPIPTPTPIPIPTPTLTPTPTPPPLALADSPKLPTGTIVMLGGLAIGALIIHAARRKKSAGKTTSAEARKTIDVLASKSLGKTKLMLVSVDDNELLLSVTDQGARLLLSWAKDDEKDDWRAMTATPPAPALKVGGPAGLRLAGGEAERSPLEDNWRALTATPTPVGIAPPARGLPAAPPPTARGTVDLGSARAPSPAVSGILKLKLGHGSAPQQPAATVAEDDEGDPNRDAAWVKELVKAARRGGSAL